jgi:hypothetical protein
VGVYFGVVLIKGQAVDGFSIRRVFRLQTFPMRGVIGSAMLAAMVSAVRLAEAVPPGLTGMPRA